MRVFTMAGTHIPEKNGRTWIFAIARNICLDRLKSPQYSAVQQMREQAEQQADSAALDFISDAELREAIAMLDMASRKIVLLHLAAGFR